MSNTEHIAAPWQPEHTLSVAEAIKEAMDDPIPTGHPPQYASRVETPRDLPAPQPHLPLRKSSAANRMQSRKGSIPKPIFTPAQKKEGENIRVARGFNPSPVLPSPIVNDVTASSEHAFAGREPRRPKNAVGLLETQQPILQYAEQPPQRAATTDSYNGGRPPSSPTYSQSADTGSPIKKSKSLKHSKSVGDGIRNLRQRMSGKSSKFADVNGTLTPDSGSPFRRTNVPNGEIRDSFRSALTSHSSYGHASSVLTIQTTHTSVSSNSEYVKIRREDYDDDDGRLTDLDMSVDDVVGMYENGFDSSARPSMEVRSIHSADVTAKNSLDDRARRSLQLDRPSSMPKHGMSPLKRPNAAHRRSQSASVLMLGAPKTQQRGLSPSPSRGPPPPAKDAKPRTSVHIVTGKLADGRPAATPAPAADVPRDRYGFKKVSHHISLEQYDAWDRGYNEHIERRRKKWYAWMKQYGLSTEGAVRFPTKSEKAKRYVRKGIPPEFRGAAWFWYAGGPRLHAKHPTLYEELLVRVEEGELTDNDREHIERDLHRTFPDNVRFKPDPTSMNDAQAGAGGGEASEEAANSSPDSMKKRNRKTKEPEVPIIQKLRRVLQCFAVHNPQIGYCQSLNFIAGLLLLFLDENEAKTLILLNLVTSIHLPGTHGVALEGANIDIGVLMSFIRDTLPAIWNKLDDKKDSSAHGIAAAANVAGGIGGLRLPTVSLATTAWFMSLFVGTLPIESVLRVWDCLFFEGSKTLFRIALAIFKAGESQILKVSDPMEIFQVVQTIPRSMLDCNALLDVCFRRRGGFAGISQGEIEQRRAAKRRQVKDGIARGDGGVVRRLKTRLRTRTGGLV